MPTFFRLSSILLIAGLVLAAIVYMTRTSSDSVDPPQPAVMAEPDELAEDLQETGVNEETVEGNPHDGGLVDEADDELPEPQGEDFDQGPELEEGEIMEEGDETYDETEENP